MRQDFVVLERDVERVEVGRRLGRAGLRLRGRAHVVRLAGGRRHRHPGHVLKMSPLISGGRCERRRVGE